MTGLEVAAIGAGAKVASPLIQAALSAAKLKLDEIPEARRTDAAAAATYLEIADQAAATLEAESDEILLTAMRLTRMADPQAHAAALLERIEGLLFGEALRPLISKMTGQLEACQEALVQEARRLHGHLGPSDAHQQLLEQLSAELGEQLEYLEWLRTDQGGVKSRASAPWVYELQQLRTLIENRQYVPASEAARRMLDDREPLAIERSQRIGALSFRLRTQFR
jgi:hypothetical protein